MKIIEISGYIPVDEPDRVVTHSPYIHTAVSPTNHHNSAYPTNLYSQKSEYPNSHHNIVYPHNPNSDKSVYPTNPYSDNSAYPPNHYNGNNVYPSNYYAHSSQSNESTNSTSQSTVVSLKQQQFQQQQHLQPQYVENEWTPCSTPTINSYTPSIMSSTLTINSSSPVINTSSNMHHKENLHYNNPSPYHFTAQQTTINMTQPTRRSASIGAPNAESIRLPPRSPYMNNSMYTPHSNTPSQPPAPPPRDLRRRLVLHTAEDSGRPMSYSFETITHTPTIARCRSSERLSTSVIPGNQAVIKPLESHLSVPDLNKTALVDDSSTRTTTTTTTTLVSGVYKPPSQHFTNAQQTTCPPKRGDVLVHEQRQTCASPMYVDSEPRSRRPIQLYASAPVLYPPPASSPGPVNTPISLSNSHKVYYNNYHPNIHPMNTLTISDLDISAEEFWAPHSGRLATASVSPACSDNLVSDDRNIKTPNRDSAIVSNVSTPPLLQNCDSQCVSEKSGKSSPTSVSSKDSGCSESGSKHLILPSTRPTARKQLQTKQKNMLDLDLVVSKSSSESTLPGMLKYLILKLITFLQKQTINFSYF